MREIKFLAVHCTATPQTATVSSIQSYWRNVLKWKMPGYHFIIKPNGEVVQLLDIEKVSNGVKGFNSVSINISYIGGVDAQNKPIDNRTEAQKKALLDLLKKLKPLLLDIEGYVGIPYWSERNQRFYDLYSSASILRSDVSENGGNMNVDLVMEPFGKINVDIDLTTGGSELFYRMKNTSGVSYGNMTVVRPEKMQSFVYAFAYDDFIVLYGIGGVNAPSVFFLRDRIETSFINRIKTFCKFIFEKM